MGRISSTDKFLGKIPDAFLDQRDLHFPSFFVWERRKKLLLSDNFYRMSNLFIGGTTRSSCCRIGQYTKQISFNGRVKFLCPVKRSNRK